MNITFSSLDPRFVQLTRTDQPCNTWGFHEVETLAEADGVLFLSPVGTNSVLCWFRDRNIPPEMTPGPGRWTASGSLATLTLSPSVDLGPGDWHGFIQNGVVS